MNAYHFEPQVALFRARASSSVPMAGFTASVSRSLGTLDDCYPFDAPESGRPTFALRIGTTGVVTAVETKENRGVSQRVLACIQDKLHKATFSAPGALGARITMTIEILHQ